MTNIKQKLFKLTISFICLVTLCSCQQGSKVLEEKMKKHIVEVAILMPLTGEEEEIGKQYIKLIKMGLSDRAKTQIKVVSYDTNLMLEDSIDKIIAQGTDIIIGPLYSATTKKVTAKIRGKGITLISLSNDPVLAENQVFVFGHAPMRQLEKMTHFLLNNEYKNYILLLPAGYHSQNVSKILQNMIQTRNAMLARIEYYTDDLENINKAVNIVSDSVDNLSEIDENLKQPVVLIADDSRALRSIFNNISKYNLDKKAVIAGDNRIDIDSEYEVDLMFTGSIKIASTNIKVRAKNFGIKHISFIHALTYDAGRMVAEYIGNDYNKEEFLAKMRSTTLFSGISGNIVFNDSIAQRQYDVIQKKKGEYIIVEKKL